MEGEIQSQTLEELVRLQEERDRARSQLLHLSRVMQQQSVAEQAVSASQQMEIQEVISNVEERQKMLLDLLHKKLDDDGRSNQVRQSAHIHANPSAEATEALRAVQALHERLQRLDSGHTDEIGDSAYTSPAIRPNTPLHPERPSSSLQRTERPSTSGYKIVSDKEDDLFKYEIERIRMDNRALAQENSANRRQIAELREETTYLHSVIKQKSDELQDRDIQIARLQLELGKGQGSHTSDRRPGSEPSLEKENQDRIRELTRVKDKLELDCRSLKTELASYLEERRRLVDCEKKLSQTESLLDTRTNELANLQIENKRILQELSTWRERGKVEVELESTRSRAGQMRRDLLSTEKELQLSVIQLEDTKKELTEARRKIKELDSRHQSEMRRNEDLEIKIDNALSELRFEKQKSNNMEVEVHTLTQKLEIMIRRQETEQKRADQLMAGIEKFEQQLRDKNKIISALQDELFRLQMALEESVHDSQTTNKKKEENTLTARDELELVREELRVAKEKVKSAEDLQTRATRMVKKLEAALESQSQRVLEERKINTELQEEVKMLKQKLQEAENALHEAQRGASHALAYQNSMQEAIAQLELCKRELAGVYERYHETTARHEQLNSRINQYEEEITRQSYVVADRDMKIQALEAEYERVKVKAERESILRHRQAQEFEQDRIRLQQLIQQLHA
eukprot:TRINITY_DN9599_c0_g1_i6.p1 TRINITY_DN9599_c0_g1~~TRINITY_DN9599_c0_g1_i6.p1  ORF type:complete len:688 (-),score=174.67 TRINITY_DN9599_c0_g1_i6:176-2239(-)